MPRYFAELCLLPDGWARDVAFSVGETGDIKDVEAGAQANGVERIDGPVMPGFPNLHSHAFQRAMAGLGERAGPGEDSFWTWRETMYRFLARIGPEEVEAIATKLYIEMLKAGYTRVGEFHYLHHAPGGTPYDDRAELARRILAAGSRAGIGVTMLPVLYGYGGFGGQDVGEAQRRFSNKTNELLSIINIVYEETKASPQVRVGIAPHSLRAVTPETLSEAVEGMREMDAAAPIHIHIAEQEKEVGDCIAWCGQRPVEWLLANQPVDRRWCLVHATHMTDQETRDVAASGAVAGLCPTTEANLGDGLFPARDYLGADGAYGIGSDSHISISPIEELRWLEYGQRLFHRRRNLLASATAQGSTGATLVYGALSGGSRALGYKGGVIEDGARADIVVLDGAMAELAERPTEALLDALIFAGNNNPVRHVMAGGAWVVRGGRHAVEEEALCDYRAALARLSA